MYIGRQLHAEGPLCTNNRKDDMNNITLITTDDPRGLSKRYKLDNEGRLSKTQAPQLVRGHFKAARIDSPMILAELLEKLPRTTAICWGVPDKEEGAIASRATAQPGDITRTKEHFHWPDGPAWMCLDFDMPCGSFEEIEEALIKHCPAIKDTPRVLAHSASTFIYKDDDTELIGEGGKRIYLRVANGRDMERAATDLFQRMQARGHARYDVSVAGTRLERGFFDVIAIGCERLDYAAGALLEGGLQQRRPAPIVKSEGMMPLNTELFITPLLPLEKAARTAVLKEKAKEIEPRVNEVRRAWIEDHVRQHKPADVEEGEYRRMLMDAAEGGKLGMDFPVYISANTCITVAEILLDRDKYHEMDCLDPLEPSYDGCRFVGRIYTKTESPNIFSFAHGCRKYMMPRRAKSLKVVAGQTVDLTAAAAAVLASIGALYRKGDTLWTSEGKQVHTAAQLECIMSSHIDFYKQSGDDDKQVVSVDCPAKVARWLLDTPGAWPFKPLEGFTDMPFMRPDGTVCDTPGYDEETGVIYDVEPMQAATVPEWGEGDEDKARAAMEVVMRPFRGYKLESDKDRAALVAAALMTNARTSLTIAPAVLITAPQYGSGKTKMAQCLAVMAGGGTATATLDAHEENVIKSLLSVLAENTPAVIFDNFSGKLHSEALANALTSDVWTGRQLGKSQMITVNTRRLFAITGCGVVVGADMVRRILPITIHPDTARPDQRRFDFDPVEEVKANRLAIRVSALAAIRWFSKHKLKEDDSIPSSYAEWDFRVRKAATYFTGCDPILAMEASRENDPEAETLRSLLIAWLQRFGDDPQITGAVKHDPDEALQEAIGSITGRADPSGIQFGLYVRRMVGRQVEGAPGTGGVYMLKEAGRWRQRMRYVVEYRGADDARIEAYMAEQRSKVTG